MYIHFGSNPLLKCRLFPLQRVRRCLGPFEAPDNIEVVVAGVVIAKWCFSHTFEQKHS